MQVAPCQPNISISTTERPDRDQCRGAREKSRHQAQSGDQLGRAEQNQRGIEEIEMMQQKVWSVPSSAPGIADWNLLAIQLEAFGSSLAGA